MKILHVAPEFPPTLGGGATYVDSLSRNLSQFIPDLEQAIFTCGEVDNDYDYTNITVFRRQSMMSSLGQTAISAKMLDSLIDIVDTYEPDVVHAFHSTAIIGVKGLSSVRAVKSVLTQLRTPEHPNQNIIKDGKSIVSEVAFKLGVSDQWVAPSKFYKDRIVASGIDGPKIKVIYPSIDFNEIKNLDIMQRPSVHEKYDINPEVPFFLLPVIDRPRKDIYCALNAITKLQQDSQVLISGISKPDQTLEDFLSENQNVKLIEHDKIAKSELFQLMRAADCVIMSSTHEGFGLAALEAIACGANVAIRNSPGLEEIATRLKHSSTFTNSSDLGQLIVKILSQDERDKTLPELVKTVFSPRTQAEKHYKLYQRIISS